MKLKKVLELNYKVGDKIKVSPVGSVVGLDGRAFIVDGAALIDSISKNALDIPLDENHDYGRATGWLDYTSFEVRADGIYAQANLTEIGTEFVEKRYYRYLSPVYIMGENRKVVGLDSVGMVNTPNLLNTALNTKEKEANMEKEELQKELNVAKATNVELNTKISMLSTQLDEVNMKLKTQMIDARIAAGELLPNSKAFAMTLEGSALDQFLELNKTNTKHLQTRTGVEANVNVIDEATKAVNAQLGIKE